MSAERLLHCRRSGATRWSSYATVIASRKVSPTMPYETSLLSIIEPAAAASRGDADARYFGDE
jgi:hypothetical protein